MIYSIFTANYLLRKEPYGGYCNCVSYQNLQHCDCISCTAIASHALRYYKSVYGSVVPRNIRRGATLRPLPGESNVEHIIRIGTAATDTACFSLRTPSSSIRVPSSVPARFEAAFTSDRYDFLCQRNKLSMGYINNRIARTTYISRRVYILT